VEEAGSNVSGFQGGDCGFGSIGKENFTKGNSGGSFCEYAVVPSDRHAKRLDSISFEEANGTVTSGATAFVATRDVANVKSDTSLLMNGFATFAVQFAKKLGGTVTVV
jgi:NADPH:quinone reductase-like Zn-dependent oxidoreductase